MEIGQVLPVVLGALAGGVVGGLVSGIMLGRRSVVEQQRRIRRIAQAIFNELRYNLRAAEYNKATNRSELLPYRADAIRLALFDPDRSIDFGRSAEQAALAYLDQLEVATLFFTIHGTVQPADDAERWRAEATKIADLLTDRAEQFRLAWKPIHREW